MATEYPRTTPGIKTALRRRKGFQETAVACLAALSAVVTVILLKWEVLDPETGILAIPQRASDTLMLFGIVMLVIWTPPLIGVILSIRLHRLLARGRMISATRVKESCYSYEFEGKPYLVVDSRTAYPRNGIPIACVDPASPNRAVILLVPVGGLNP